MISEKFDSLCYFDLDTLQANIDSKKRSSAMYADTSIFRVPNF